MSAPAMNVRPAQTMTMACTAPSAVACLIPSCSPLRTCWLSALTGGLSTVSTATRPWAARSTDWVIFAMGLLASVESAAYDTPQPPERRTPPPERRTGSAAQPLGQVLEVSRDDVPLARRRDVLVRVRAMLVRSRHEGRSEAECLRVTEVAIVGGDHHALGGCEPEERGRGQIGLGLRLVVPRDLGAEDGVPGKPPVLGHVHDQRDVAVRERGENELLLEARQARHRVGPGVEAVPGAGQGGGLGPREAPDAALDQQLIEALAVEVVELRPRAPAAPHLVHRRLVESAPPVGEPGPVRAEAFRLPERLAFSEDRKSTRLNSSHLVISYAVFCLKKKKKQ